MRCILLRSANRPPGLYAPQLGGRIWAGNSLCTTPLGPPDQDPSGFWAETPPRGGLAGCVTGTANLALCPRVGRMRSHGGGLGSSFFVRFGKPPARLAFIPGQMGHTSPMTRRGDAKKGTADFGPFQSISPQGRPCGDLSTDSPHGAPLGVACGRCVPLGRVDAVGRAGGPWLGPGMPPTRSPWAHCGPRGLWRCRKPNRT